MILYQNIRFTLLCLAGISVLHASVVTPKKPKVETKAKKDSKAKKKKKKKKKRATTKGKVQGAQNTTYKIRLEAVVVGMSVFTLLYLTMQYRSRNRIYHDGARQYKTILGSNTPPQEIKNKLQGAKTRGRICQYLAKEKIQL